MRRANNTGTVVKLNGNRYKPYAAYISGEIIYNEEKQTCYRKRTAIGYYSTKKEAQLALDEYVKTPYNLDNINITFGTIWDKVYNKLSLSESRMQQLRLAYKNYCQTLANMPMRDVKTEQLQAVIDGCPYGSNSKDNIKSIMNKCFDYAMANDIVQKDYTKYVKYKHNEASVERVLFDSNAVAVLWDHWQEWQYAYILILLYTGMRPSELTELKKENINLEEGYFNVIKSKTDAGVRTVPIHSKLKPVFAHYMQVSNIYLLNTTRGAKIEYRNYMGREYKTVRDQLGTDHTPYECRHTFITKCRECGVDDLCLQRIVGHKVKSITQRVYTHLELEELQREIDKLELCN